MADNLKEVVETVVETSKDPFAYSLITYTWVSILSAWGGVVGYLQKVKGDADGKFSLAELIGEVVSAAFVGMLTFWLCELSEMPQMLTAAVTGISGLMSAKVIYIFETYGTKLLKGLFSKL